MTKKETNFHGYRESPSARPQRLIGVHPILIRPLKLLFSQHTGCWAQFAPPATPIAVIGEQVRPTRTSTPWTTTPNRARTPAAAGSEADETELQH